ncbi:permease prefix domain 1-containing protein [Helcococcus kunzii]|uniref:permease prefix domain 1-containing protein n=1 Tax=Helcococcus kunzii TaxID=40091 RepID=UPI0024AD194E|nr:permease prefix domain 1-containing protein [Helcococcus kunzii]
MDAIKSYLDNMFLGLPKSQKINAAKEELLEMMNDKYTQLLAEGKTDNEAVGIVISEFGNINEVAEVLGIEKELSQKEEIKLFDTDYVKEYLQTIIDSSSYIALGVFLAIICAIPVFILYSFADEEMFGITEKSAGIIGLPILFILLAISILLFIMKGSKLNKYEFLEKESNFKLTYDAENYTKEFRSSINIYKIVGISVFAMILSIIPVIVLSTIVDNTTNEKYLPITVSILWFTIAIGVFFIVKHTMRYSATSKLLQLEDYSPENKKANNVIGGIAAIFWTLMTTIYLIYSFLTNDWGRSWIIWPIAGIVFGFIATIVNVFVKKDK